MEEEEEKKYEEEEEEENEIRSSLDDVRSALNPLLIPTKRLQSESLSACQSKTGPIGVL